MAKRWHKKHISTKWGIVAIGILLLAVALLIPYLKQNQYIKGNAMYYVDDDIRLAYKSCSSQGGKCLKPGTFDSKMIQKTLSGGSNYTIYCAKQEEKCYKLKSSCYGYGTCLPDKYSYSYTKSTYTKRADYYCPNISGLSRTCYFFDTAVCPVGTCSVSGSVIPGFQDFRCHVKVANYVTIGACVR